MAAPLVVDVSTTGITSGTPITTFTLAAGVEQEVNFSNWPSAQTRTIVLETDTGDTLYSYSSGGTAAPVNQGEANFITTFGGRDLFFSSATGGDVWIRVA